MQAKTPGVPTKNVEETLKTPSLKSQSAWLLFAKTVGFAFSFLLPLLVVRFLTQDEVGVYRQVFLVIANANAILPLGVAISAYYYLSRETTRRGAAVYRAQCAACHGDYAMNESAAPQLVRVPNWIGDVGTDPLRARLFDAELRKAVGNTGYRKLIAVKAGRGYAAPPMAGLWSSAPYLHYGSVTSLGALLDPTQRQARFLVGGHALELHVPALRAAADVGQRPAVLVGRRDQALGAGVARHGQVRAQVIAGAGGALLGSGELQDSAS